MENREVLQSIMAAFQKKASVLLAEKKAERAKIGILDNGLFVYYFEGEQVCKGCSAAKTPDGRTIDTRCAEMVIMRNKSSQPLMGLFFVPKNKS